MRLGAILAGGLSTRFGSDKATARLDGLPLLSHVLARLQPQVSAVIVAGRDWPGLLRVDDAPEPGLGPLGGLLGALRHAGGHGYQDVLTVPCDCPDLPLDLAERLAPAPAVIETLPVLGLWQAALAPALDAHLASGATRSIRGWAEVSAARSVTLPAPLANLNTPEALERFTWPAGPRSSR